MITHGKEVSLEYTLKLDDGSVVDTNVGSEPLQYTHGSQQIIMGLESALEGMMVGEVRQVCVSPGEGYGLVDRSAFHEVDKGQLPPEAIVVGAQLQGKNPAGNRVLPRVAEVKEATVILDFNHPLAGKTLFFEVKVLDVE